MEPAPFDVAVSIFLANYFLRYAFYVVMVRIEAFWVRWTHRSDQSTDSQLVRSPSAVTGARRKLLRSQIQ